MENAPDLKNFQWDASTRKHLGRHRLGVAIVYAVIEGPHRVFPNTPGRLGSHIAIGTDRRGRFWTIIFVQATNGKWRPVTGWPSTPREIRRYREAGNEEENP